MKSRIFHAAVALTFVACGEADDPDQERSDAPDGPFPGYCTAHTEIDGVPGADGERIAFYDEERVIREEFDSDLDGDVDVIDRHTYDDDGRPVRWTTDRFADDEIDEIREYIWDGERMLTETWDQGADGSIEMTLTYEHAEDDLRIRGLGNVDDQGQPGLVATFTYDDRRLLERFELDGLYAAPDGAPDRIVTHSYDSLGNLSLTWLDVDADEVGDILVTFTYECWE